MINSHYKILDFLLFVCLVILIYFNLLLPGHPSSLIFKGASPWVKTNETSVRLISESLTIGANDSIKLGLQFELKEGWKIYWRSPGDAGLPPKIEWNKSANLQNTQFYWPVPTRFSFSGIETLGYKKEVIFPILVKVKDNKNTLELRAKINYLACNDVCIPYTAKINLDIPPGAITQYIASNRTLINKYMSKIPIKGEHHKLRVIRSNLVGSLLQTGEHIREGFIEIEVENDMPFDKPDIYLEGPESILFGSPQITLNSSRTLAKIRVPVVEEGKPILTESSLTATIRDSNRSFERSLAINEKRMLERTNKTLTSFLVILAFALLGGLILNLMPCVLPVISIKILSILSTDKSERGTVRKNFIASALGIICCFLFIASILISFKLAGKTIGWGIQFQYPWFIIGLSIIVVLFAYNLWDIFEIRTPHWINKVVGSNVNEHINQNSFSYNFLSGIFATVLATPCSAPFLGTAIGFGLAGNTLQILLIFLLLGVGMALPYIAVATFPNSANILPKPGAWMLTVKRILGLALIGTAIWLLSIIAIQISQESALYVGILLCLIGLILLGNKKSNRNYRITTFAIVTAMIVGAMFIPYVVEKPNQNSKQLITETYWQEFKPENIPGLIKKGKTVFIDITAEWCITCKVNKATVLKRNKITALLATDSIVAMRGDWTSPDDSILEYLREFDRYGIPFNAVYGPNIISGKILPELLTTEIVIKALEEASIKTNGETRE